MTKSGDGMGEVENFKYSESFIQRDGSLVVHVRHRIKYGWMKWREASGVLCDKKISMRLKDKFYRSVVNPTS